MRMNVSVEVVHVLWQGVLQTIIIIVRLKKSASGRTAALHVHLVRLRIIVSVTTTRTPERDNCSLDPWTFGSIPLACFEICPPALEHAALSSQLFGGDVVGFRRCLSEMTPQSPIATGPAYSACRVSQIVLPAAVPKDPSLPRLVVDKYH